MQSVEWMSALIVLAGVLYVISVGVLFGVTRKRRGQARWRFFLALWRGLQSGSITTMCDVVNVYKGVAGLGGEDIGYRYGLTRLLREFLVELVSKTIVIDGTLEDQVVVTWKERISKFIAENEEISPYADLPPAERNLLSDMSTFLEKNDIESTKRKLLELAGMIQARSDDLDKVRGMNKWSVPLAIIGMVLTVLFGLTAIFK